MIKYKRTDVLFMDVKKIAYIKTDFKEKFGIPRQSGRVEELKGQIIFLPEYQNDESIRGLENYSHIWLLFDFSLAHREDWSPTVRPPRLGGNKRIGVFASRSPFRPNPIGLSCVRIEKIEKTKDFGSVITVSGVDLLDGTPILDIKPYIPYADCKTDATGSFAEQLKDYKIEVDFPDELIKTIPEEKRSALIRCIAEDPRPSYQQDENKIYKMSYCDFDIHFKVANQTATVIKVEKI